MYFTTIYMLLVTLLWERCPEPREQLWGRPLVGGLRCQARSQTLPEQGH